MVHPGRGRVELGWTTTETAARTGLSVTTIIRMIDAGELLATRPRGTWRYVDPQDGELLARAIDPSLTEVERLEAQAERAELHRLSRRGGPPATDKM